MSDIKIDVGIPVPTINTKFPFLKMQVNDSFFIPGREAKDFTSTAYSCGIKHGMKFAVRTVKGGCRCWRIE